MHLRERTMAHLKSMPLMDGWKSMKGLMASMTPSGILSISSKMKSVWAHALTLPRIQSWRFSCRGKGDQ